MPFVPAHLRHRARELRSSATEAEAALWQQLRGHRLDGLGFRRQAPWQDYILDFVCPAAQLVIEVDGAQHYDDATEAYDERRTRQLQAAGYEVVRYQNDDVLARMDIVLEDIVARARGRLGGRATVKHPPPGASGATLPPAGGGL